MYQRLLAVALSLVLFAGCGGPRPEPFSNTGKPLAQNMQTAIGKKDMTLMTKVITLAKDRAEKGKLTRSELSVLQGAYDYAQDEDWESAGSLIGASLSQTSP